MSNTLKGYKTKIGAAGLIASGLALIASGLSAEAYDFDKITQGFISISAGLAVFGLRVADWGR